MYKTVFKDMDGNLLAEHENYIIAQELAFETYKEKLKAKFPYTDEGTLKEVFDLLANKEYIVEEGYTEINTFEEVYDSVKERDGIIDHEEIFWRFLVFLKETDKTNIFDEFRKWLGNDWHIVFDENVNLIV